ncbi:hypothetical protein [Lutibaculum baratangense]|uniref:Uncharacterized protein n=1 Tax=Lutibaculum baratangense AMV1 TaxID=631454 RepID=V4RHT8_9HYPH|nr:hypothetical protein [Lutibaculum baratangense]ESR25696.1 hypothetical protein N177_1529 [Lutibaculum baratangense AMV1]
MAWGLAAGPTSPLREAEGGAVPSRARGRQGQVEDAGTADGGGHGVYRRRVLYVHGFDPRGPRVYHGFFREGAGIAAGRFGRTLSVSPRRKAGPHASAWTVEATDEATGQRTVTDYEVLRWDDIVRDLWTARSPLRLILEAFRVLLFTWRAGILRTHYRPARAGFLAILTPPAIIAAAALAAVLLTLAAYAAISALAGALGAGATTAALAGAAAAGAVLVGVFLLWRVAETRTNLWWLTRCLDYLLGTASGRTDRSVARAEHFAGRLVEAWRSGEDDEILVVGHSLGALHAVRMVAGALRQEEGIGRRGARVALLTLGQTIPFYNMLGEDRAFREDLVLLGTTDRITFFDVTSGSDPGSACRLPMLEGMDVRPEDARVVQREPDFHDILGPETFRHVRARPLEFHFQYLKPSERGTRFDYFEIVTRPAPLRAVVREAA